MNINLVVKLNYLVFFCAVMNFLTSIDPLIDEAISRAYRVIVPPPVGALVRLLWPFGYTTFVYFITGVAIVLNVDALSNVASPVDLIRNRMMMAANSNRMLAEPVRLYSVEAVPEPSGPAEKEDRQVRRTSSHIADYVRTSTPVVYPDTNRTRITYFFPNDDVADNIPPKSHKSFVVLTPEEIARLEALAEADHLEEDDPVRHHKKEDEQDVEEKKPPEGEDGGSPKEEEEEERSPPPTPRREKKEAEPPRSYKKFVILPPEELAKLQAVAAPEHNDNLDQLGQTAEEGTEGGGGGEVEKLPPPPPSNREEDAREGEAQCSPRVKRQRKQPRQVRKRKVRRQ